MGHAIMIGDPAPSNILAPGSKVGPGAGSAVLVTDANQRSALAITRSLGARGVRVIAADSVPETLAGSSRFSADSAQYVDPYRDPEGFVADLRALVSEHDIGLIVPATEVTTYLVAANQSSLHPAASATPPYALFDLLSDKYRLFKLAEELGQPMPRTRFVDNPSDAVPSALEIGFPVVVKPYRSRILTGGHWLSTTVRYAHDRDELEALIEGDESLRQHPFLLQEFVRGVGQGLFALYDQGRPLALFCHRRIREKPPSGGVSVLSESVPVDPALERYATQLLDHVGWHGLAMVEYKVGADGTPYLMEVNPRFWGSLQLAVDAGVDFPWMLYQVATGTPVDRVPDYTTGRRLRWLLGDLDRLYLVLKDRHSGIAEKLKEVAAFSRPDFRRVHHEVDRLGDFRPFLRELTHYIRDLF